MVSFLGYLRAPGKSKEVVENIWLTSDNAVMRYRSVLGPY